MKIKKILVGVAVLSGMLLGTVSASAREIVQYVHTDALGSPVAISDANGAIIERTVYEPYGAVVGGAKGDRPGFTGHVSDSATGLTYMQQRYYDPEVGAFYSADPVGVDTKSGAGFSRYEYASSNPYYYTDPDGRLPEKKEEQPPPAAPTDLPPVRAAAPAIVMPGTTTLPTVLATATRPVPLAPVSWSAVGEVVVSRASLPLLLLWPTEMGASPCEFSGGAPCGANVVYSKGKENKRDSGLRDVSDEEINRRARDPSTSAGEKRRYQTEQKARGIRNKNKRQENY